MVLFERYFEEDKEEQLKSFINSKRYKGEENEERIDKGVMDSNIEFIPLNRYETQINTVQNQRQNQTNYYMDDYQRRSQVERNTRSFFQTLFNSLEESSIFTWIRNYFLSGQRRQRSYYQSRRNYDGYSYGYNPYSRHESFIENVVDKWISFRESASSQKPEQEKLEEDKRVGQDFANRIDRYMNQENRYFHRQQERKTYLQMILQILSNFGPKSILLYLLAMFGFIKIFF